MSLIRGLAIRVSGLVVRFASPGSEVWARALEAEVEFVEGDWNALGWALGSLRVLLRYREAQVVSLEDLIIVMRKYVQSRRAENWTWLIFLMQAFDQMENWRSATEPLQRFGSGMAAISNATLLVLLLLRLWTRFRIPKNEDTLELLRFYQVELERVRDLPRKASTWIGALAVCCLMVGLMLGQGGSITSRPIWNSTLVLFLIGLFLLSVHVRRANLRRLGRLKILLAEQS